MICPLCKGEMQQSKTHLPIQRGDKLLVIKDVPALVCSQCGESFVEYENIQIVEKISDSVFDGGLTMGFVEFTKVA
jgi:YgiT-type zinc finger domain-containing protein